VLKFADRFPVVILRPGAVYGPRDEDFLEFFRWIRKGVLPSFGPAGQRLSLCYVGDVVRAVLLALKSDIPSGEIFNIASAQPCSWQDLGKAAAAVLGRKVRRVRIPGWTVFMAAVAAEGLGHVRRRPTAVNLSKYKDMKAEEWVMDVRKAKDVLGFETRTSLEEGLKETLDWYLRNGRL
jgi:nucleoside-diphosphate-sugar epimerase